MVGFDPTATDVTFPGQIIMDYVSIKNAAARNATCNDGTAAGYYLHMSPTNSTKWMIYLEGGGLCYDLESCTKRPKILTSSTPWPKQLGAYGILNNLTTNRFNDFNKVGAGACSVVWGAHGLQRGICRLQVIVIYCTSDLYSGTVAQGNGLLGWSFHGHYIVPSVIEDLQQLPSFALGTELLFTGGSAGGVGVFVNYPYVKETVTWMPVKALPDAGWFLTTIAPYSKKSVPVPKMLKEGMAAWRGLPGTKCMDALGADAYQCYSGPIAYLYMPQPLSDLMVCKAQTDAWTVGHDVRGCGANLAVVRLRCTHTRFRPSVAGCEDATGCQRVGVALRTCSGGARDVRARQGRQRLLGGLLVPHVSAAVVAERGSEWHEARRGGAELVL